MQKLNYGIDAPKVIRNLLVIGAALVLCSLLVPKNAFLPVSEFIQGSTLAPGVSLLICGSMMYAYAKIGKFQHRDKMLNLYGWKGNEKVLDVGTGLGLLMIGAAKKLSTGKSFGIDIFNNYDLSGNNIAQTNTNAKLEGVAEKVKVLNENILKTSFQNQYFDVVLSNLCLHNIYNADERKQACVEINRVLKTGGKAIISDFKHSGQYKKVFESLGMKIEKKTTYFLSTFPPLTIIVATKM